MRQPSARNNGSFGGLHPETDRRTTRYDITLATLVDVPAILALQEVNLYENGGGLSARQTGEWFQRTMSEMPIVVGRREGTLVGYLLATSLAAKAHVAIVQTMLRVFPPPPDCYLSGPGCVADSERGNGLAAILYAALQARLAGRPAMTFIRVDNRPSLRAHRKMGMKELGEFVTDGETYIAFGYNG